jgi:hypothetical protein
MTGRGLRGRRLAGLMLVSVLAIDAFVALLFIATPNCMCPMYIEPPPLLLGLSLGSLLLVIGIALHLGGLAWMVRLLRADPEGHRSWWRFDRS